MAPKLYGIAPSPPVRAVQLCARAIGLDLEWKNVNLLEKEHLNPEFLKINPQHLVPTLDDDGFILWDSHAIILYLVEKYGKDASLYPKDLQAKATVRQRLFFDTGILFPRMLVITRSIIFQGAKTIPKELSDALVEAYGFVEAYLQKTKFVAGDELSVADFSLITTITSCDVVVPLDSKNYPKTVAWIKEMEALPYYDANKTGLDLLKELVKSKLDEN